MSPAGGGMTTLETPISAPLLLPAELHLSSEQFALVCQANPDAVLELSANGHLISMTPTGGDTSARNSALNFALQTYAKDPGGWKAFDGSGGFASPMAPCSAPIWWWNWPVQVIKAPAACQPCAARRPITSPRCSAGLAAVA